ncbi:hypothetical protein [Mycolicibacterium neworleansense]|uniref:PASTA domain-containing protein n=1 Tax=Mycolicibacterium neworleansense TaxID=146018 RepID=A0A0H5SAS9_9MYCO|nr:hypothetical protein [Mycolicibacterium neworleansense]MCV7360939.1 hypothetical protein [Mycolicibacterium neworleansense]CRZ18494.1 hypothetical protein BN2156_05397 [Mycolicibacterium neworleansense]
MYGLAGAVLTGGALSALALGFPAATAAAPSGVDSAQDTADELQRQGFDVVIYKAGTAPLDRCTVSSVRPAQILEQTVYLSANC